MTTKSKKPLATCEKVFNSQNKFPHFWYQFTVQ